MDRDITPGEQLQNSSRRVMRAYAGEEIIIDDPSVGVDKSATRRREILRRERDADRHWFRESLGL